MKGIRLQVIWNSLIVLTVTLSLILPAVPTIPVLAHESSGLLGLRDPVAVTTGPSVVSEQDRARIQTILGQLPLYFIENRGQVDRQVAYYAQGSHAAIYFTPDGLTFALSSPVQRWAVKLDFVDANPDVKPAGEDKTEAIISYFKGRPEEWQVGLPTYSQMIYHDLWTGIELVYSGQANQLKYEFRVRPGTDPARIRLAYQGAEQVSLTAAGALRVDTPAGSFTDTAPVVYQEVEGQKIAVRAAFDLSGSEYGFRFGAYDATRLLIIDPSMFVYCGYIGGSGNEAGTAIAVDGGGNAYVTGQTDSSQASFPVTIGPDLIHNGNVDAFVAKIQPESTNYLPITVKNG